MSTSGEFLSTDMTVEFLEPGSVTNYYALTTYVNGVTLSRSAGEAEVTTHGSGGYRQYITGLKEGELSFTLMYNTTPAYAQRPQTRVRQLFENLTRTTWRLRPNGTGTGLHEITHSGVVTGFEEDFNLDDQAVSAAVTVRVNGAITDSTQS
jgi:hypothetical protein